MKRPYAFLFAGFLSSGLLAQYTSAGGNLTAPKIKLSGYGYYMFGQVVSGIYGDNWEAPTTTFRHLWLSTCLQHLGITSNVTDWFTTNLGFELSVGFYQNSCCSMEKANYLRNYKAYLASAEGIMHWDFEQPLLNSLKIETGLFPYTINSPVKTLGNYLFRSTIHPPSIQNKVDYPWADFSGSIAEVGLFDNKVSVSAMLASEFNYVPFYDFTPAFALYYKPDEIIDVGGAIAFDHAIHVHSESIPDSIAHKWQGIKLDFRVIFDPRPLFGGMPFLGKDQFKIYAELAFLGVEDKLEVDTSNLAALRSMDTTSLKDLFFPENSIAHRMPFMLGINLPTWKILDLLSIELEWFYSPYANDWFGLFSNQKAEAKQPGVLSQWDNYINKDNFKWAIHIIKSVGNFEARSFFGSDHTVSKLFNQANGNFEQTMKRKGDWQWYVKLQYNL